MADNTTLNTGTGGDVISSDDIGGVKVQRVKVQFGGDGSATDVAAGSPLPVTAAAQAGVDLGDVTVNNATGAGSIPVQGAVAIDAALAQNPVTVGGRASTATPTAMSADGDVQAIWLTLNGAVNVADAGGSLTVDNGGTFAVQAAQSGTWNVGTVTTITNVVHVDDNAGSLTVDGTVSVSGTVTVGSHAVTNAGTFAVQVDGSALTSLQLIDDPVATVAAAVPTKGMAAAGTDGTNARLLKTDASGELQVDVLTLPALAAGTANIGDVDVLTLPALPAGTNNIGDVDVLTLPALPAGTNNIGDVDVLTLPALPAGNNNIGDVDVASGPTGASALQAQGTVAHDGVDAQNPIGLGARAIAHGTNPTAVAAADRTVLYANRAGVPFVIGGHPNPVTLEAAYTAAQTDTAIVTVGAGAKIVVTRCTVTADKANTVDVGYRVGFGATNTPTTTGVVSSHPGLAAGSGVVEGNGGGMLGVGADGEDLRITSEVPTTGSLRVVVTYYTIES